MWQNIPMALSTERMHTSLQGHKNEIRNQLMRCAEQYQYGISLIDRSGYEWKLRHFASIEDIYSYFVSAHRFVGRACDQVSRCKLELETNLLDMANQSTRLSEDISKASRHLTGIKASLALKETSITQTTNTLKSVEKELQEKKTDLEEKEQDYNTAVGVTAGALAAGGALVLLFPPSAPVLYGAGAAFGTASISTGASIILKNEVSNLENKRDSCKNECHMISKELEGLRNEERRLESDRYSKTREIEYFNTESEKLRGQIAEVAYIVQQVKSCFSTLGMIINKFEVLKEESNPEYCYDLTTLKIPVQELENCMNHHINFLGSSISYYSALGFTSPTLSLPFQSYFP